MIRGEQSQWFFGHTASLCGQDFGPCFLIRIEDLRAYFTSVGRLPSFAGKFLIFAEKEQRAD